MVDDKKAQKTGMHSLILENRERLTVTGVVDVESFNDEMVVADTEMGLLIIRGEDLHINKLSVESSELSIEGYIASLEYSDKDGRSKGMSFFAKMFR